MSEAKPPRPELLPAQDSPQDHGINVVPETGLVPVERPDPLLYCTIFFVFANILVPSALLNTILYLILLGYCVAVPFLWQRRKQLPDWAQWLTEPLITRLSTCPSEFILVPAIGVLVISKWFPSPGPQRWREFGLCLLLISGYWLSNHATLLLSGYRSRLFKIRLFGKAQPPRPAPTVLDDLSEPASPLAKTGSTDTVTVQRRLWEKRQQQRWEDWMQEELTRLDGEAYTKTEDDSDR